MLVNGSTSTQRLDYTHNAPAQRNVISEGFDRISRNISRMSLPILLGATAMALPMVDGGPLTYYSCVAGCEALATVASGGPGAAFIQACILACLPLFAMPTCP